MNAQTAQRMLEFIESNLADGRTVYVHTAYRVTKVTPKTYANWKAAGRPLFKLDKEGRLRMAFGKRYDIIDICPITAS